MAVRQDVLIFGKPGNFMAEMHGPHALKQLVRKGGMSFSRISHTRSGVCVGKVNRPTMFFYLAVATSRDEDEERDEHFCLVSVGLSFSVNLKKKL